MARDPEHRADSFEPENTGGLLTGFLADEDDFDRRALWRLGSWGAASVGAVIVAVLASQSSMGWRRTQVAASDPARQAQQIQLVAKETLKESLSETRRLASAIDTLNGDRDRLYSRITVLEQGLESVTGSVARQISAAASPQAAATPATTATATAEPPPAPQNPPSPTVSAVATVPAAAPEKPAASAPAAEPGPAAVSSTAQGSANETPAVLPSPPLMASKSVLAPPDSAPAKLIEPETLAKDITRAPMPPVVASVAPSDEAEASSPGFAVRRTEFGVDVGGANSVAGLRALWRGLLKSRSNAVLTTLRPIIVVKEANNGLGMQLRLVAGPLDDAAGAAKICAALIAGKRTCETTVFEGQRLAIKAEEPPAAAKPAPRRPVPAKRSAAEEPAKKPEPSMLSTVFGNR
jgi:hypothetical protein